MGMTRKTAGHEGVEQTTRSVTARIPADLFSKLQGLAAGGLGNVSQAMTFALRNYFDAEQSQADSRTDSNPAGDARSAMELVSEEMLLLRGAHARSHAEVVNALGLLFDLLQGDAAPFMEPSRCRNTDSQSEGDPSPRTNPHPISPIPRHP